MRKTATVLVLAAALLVATRALSGIVYERDQPVAELVLKSAPRFEMEWAEGDANAPGVALRLDSEEGQLSYGWLYLALMRAVPTLTVAALILSLGLMLLGRPGAVRSVPPRRPGGPDAA